MTRRITTLAVLLAVACCAWAAPAATAQSGPGQGPGGPILVVTNDAFGGYYAEILRAEGLNEFAVAPLGSLSAQTLASYQVVVLGQTALNDAQVAMFDGWVQAGGDLIAMRPDPKLAGLLGLAPAGAAVANGYVDVDESRPPGAGITGVTMQFHGTADRYSASGATTVASLHASSNGAALGAAVTARGVGGAGGSASAFAYDLARSVVGTRQGNPALDGVDQDTDPPIRSNDLYAGNWLDFSKVRIPQADEQQRLLANLITQQALDRVPLPRFWYLPRGEKAAVVMTGDDHGDGSPGTMGQFDRFDDASPQGCNVAAWACVRGTSYMFPEAGIVSNAAAVDYQSARLRAGAAPVHELRRLRLRPRGGMGCPARRLQGPVARPRRAAHEPHALRRVERLGRHAQGGARAVDADPVRHELLLLAGVLRPGPSRAVHRLRVPDALRRHRRHAARRLPGRDADHRRADRRAVGLRAPAHPGADRRRARRRLLRRLHDEHAHRPPGPRGRERDRGGGGDARRPGRLGQADARLARRPQRLRVPGPAVRRGPARVHDPGQRRRPRGDGPGELGGRRAARRHPGRRARRRRGADRQGHRVPRLPRDARRVRRELPEHRSARQSARQSAGNPPGQPARRRSRTRPERRSRSGRREAAEAAAGTRPAAATRAIAPRRASRCAARRCARAATGTSGSA